MDVGEKNRQHQQQDEFCQEYPIREEHTERLSREQNQQDAGDKGGRLEDKATGGVGLDKVFKVAIDRVRRLPKAETLVDHNQVVERCRHEYHG